MKSGNEESFRPTFAKVSSIVDENANVKTFGFTLQKDTERKGFSFTPGQLVMLTLPGIGEAPFSMCSSPEEKGFVEFSVRNVGNEGVPPVALKRPQRPLHAL